MFSRLIVAYEVWETEKAEYAKYLIRKATLSQGIAGRPLVLHSDNGRPMKAATFQATLEKLGVQSSFSRPRVSNDNPYSESLFKTMKYRPKYLTEGFSSIDEARKWVEKFANWYNFTHLHSGINFLTPMLYGMCLYLYLLIYIFKLLINVSSSIHYTYNSNCLIFSV